MPSSCWVPNCTKRCTRGSAVKFYRFPLTNVMRLNRWVEKNWRLPPPKERSPRPDGMHQPKKHKSAHFVNRIIFILLCVAILALDTCVKILTWQLQLIWMGSRNPDPFVKTRLASLTSLHQLQNLSSDVQSLNKLLSFTPFFTCCTQLPSPIQTRTSFLSGLVTTKSPWLKFWTKSANPQRYRFQN